MSNWTTTLPNPDVYLNHLPPEQARQFEVVKIVQVASLGAIVWDIFSFIPQDIQVLKRGGAPITSVCFVLTRFLAAVYVSLWVVSSTHPIADCQKLMLATNIVCFFLMGITSFLFLRRVQAVWAGNRRAYWFFAFLFVCSSISHVMLILGMDADHIPGTNYCTTYRVELFASITYFMPGLFDTVVFFAISYKIAYQGHKERSSLPNGNPVTRFFSGKSLPLLSRAVLQGGQQYYLVGIIFRLVAVILMFDPSVPVIYRALVLTPDVVVTSSMACRVHRLMVLAFYDTTGEASRTIISRMQFARPDLKRSEKSLTNSTIETATINIHSQV